MDIDDANETQDIQEGFFLQKITDDDIERACLMKTHAREQWLTAVNLDMTSDCPSQNILGFLLKNLSCSIFLKHVSS